MHHRTRRLALILVLAQLGCGASVPPIPPTATEREAAATIGRVVDHHVPESGRLSVFIIMDRHPARAGLHRVRPQLERIQREHRLLVEHLIRAGYSLLGCEQPRGPVVESEETRLEYQIVRSRLHPIATLDEYAIFQPIRYAVLWPAHLRVVGVEDPELYAADHANWKRWAKAGAVARRRDREPAVRVAAADEARAAAAALDANVERRGAACADNLVAEMSATEVTRAILIVGGAHVPAAAMRLKELGASYLVFQSHAYDVIDDGSAAIDDDVN